jgi:CheY-like chemotaxis protein
MASILLVDDDDVFLAMLSAVLTRAGYQVIVAFDGQRAINLYKSRPTDLVITDLVMPEKEGLELIGELKRFHPEVKIIVVSGAGKHALEDYLKMAKALGANRVLAKPFSEREILEAISEVLEEE